MIGITDYGFYIPKNRIKVEEIAKNWQKCSDKISQSLKITEKAVASTDEDIVTMGYEASAMALKKYSIKEKSKIGAVFIGSETFPYAVKPHSTIIASFLGLSGDYVAYDTQFACKATTGALISAYGLVKSGEIESALVVASDKANARPGDVLEYSAGSGSNAFVLGSENVIGEILGWHSFSSDTPDFWRRSGQKYPSHAGRFTGSPSYFFHIASSSKKLLEKLNAKPSDFKYAVFHMPNGTFPLKIGNSLGFTTDQILPSYVVSQLGNSYSASALMGLCATFDNVKSGDTVFFASYGSGAGSDAIAFKIHDAINFKRQNFKKTMSQKKYINYSTYSRYMGIF